MPWHVCAVLLRRPGLQTTLPVQTAEAVDAAWAALEVVGKTLTGRANAWMDPAARPRREVTTLASPAQVAARAKAKAKRAARRAGVIPLNYGGPVHFL